MVGGGNACGFGIAGGEFSGAVWRRSAQFSGKVSFKGGLISVEAEVADGTGPSGEGPGAKDG